MADSKITDLTSASFPLAGDEFVYLVQSGDDRQTTVKNITGNTPSTIAYAATIAPVSKSNATYRIILTGNLTLNLPTGGADGDRVKLWLTASGADRVLTLNAGYKIPASSVFASPVIIPSGKKAKLLLEYDGTQNGGQWELTSFINGY